jgi:hypothetical protein
VQCVWRGRCAVTNLRIGESTTPFTLAVWRREFDAHGTPPDPACSTGVGAGAGETAAASAEPSPAMALARLTAVDNLVLLTVREADAHALRTGGALSPQPAQTPSGRSEAAEGGCAASHASGGDGHASDSGGEAGRARGGDGSAGEAGRTKIPPMPTCVATAAAEPLAAETVARIEARLVEALSEGGLWTL